MWKFYKNQIWEIDPTNVTTWCNSLDNAVFNLAWPLGKLSNVISEIQPELIRAYKRWFVVSQELFFGW